MLHLEFDEFHREGFWLEIKQIDDNWEYFTKRAIRFWEGIKSYLLSGVQLTKEPIQFPQKKVVREPQLPFPEWLDFRKLGW